ncbi:MAG: transposase, partial [Methanothrix sp.]
KPGYPRFKGRGWYKSFTYPDAGIGYKIEGSKLILSGIGAIRIFKHREIEGKIKTCTIKRDSTGAWYAIFSTDTEEEPPRVEPETAIGVDVGIKNAVTLSTGETFSYPRYLVQMEKKLAAAQRCLSRKIKGSKNWIKQKLKVAKIHKKIRNLRNEFLHQISKKIVDKADLIVFENLNIKSMVRNHSLAKHILDHSWGRLIQYTTYKAARAGKSVELVDSRYTSQRCSGCGIIVPKTLEDRVHECPRCGIKLDRDHNAALNILTLGLRGSACGEAATEVDAASTLVEAYRITGSMKPSTKSKQVEAQEALLLQGKGGSHGAR